MRETLQLTLCLTHDCTLRCAYCYAGRKYAHSMTRETAGLGMEIGLAEAQRTGRGVDVSFFGGEPLLEWDLLRYCYDYMLRRAAELGITVRFGITTNGTLLTRERLEWMAERDFLVGLSVDGSPEMHNVNRRYADGQGSHAAVAQALALIKEFPTLRSRVICVVNPANCHLLSEGVQWLHEHYAGVIGLNFDYWSAWSDAQFKLLCRQLEDLQQMMLESYRVGTPIREENIEGKIWSAFRDAESVCERCFIGEQEIAVSVDGHIFPCSRMVGVGDAPEITFGNVYRGIDRARQNYFIATRGNATPECRLCELRHRCLNTCGCTNYAGTGRINRVSPFLCNLEQKLIEVADTLAEALYQESNLAFMQRFYRVK